MRSWGPLTVAPWGGATVDAAVTRFELPDDEGAVLFPVQGWIEVRVGWRP